MMMKIVRFSRYVSLAIVCTGLGLAASGSILDWGDTASNNFKLLDYSFKFLAFGIIMLFFVEFFRSVNEQRIESFFSSIFLLFLATGTGLALVDWAAGAMGITQSNFSRELGLNPRRLHIPYLSFRGLPSSEAMGHNRFGYRGPDPSKKSGNEFRVFVFGGSTVWRGEPPLSDLWTKIAGRKGRPNVRFYNFGVVGSVARQDVARAIMEGLSFAPDMIVMYNGGNDVITPFWQDPRPGYPYDYYVWESNPYLTNNPGLGNLLRSVLANSNIGRYLLQSDDFRLISFGVHRLREKVGFQDPDWINDIAKTYLDSQQLLQDIAKGMGIAAVTIFQPLHTYGKNSRYPLISQARSEIIRLQRQKYSDLSFLDLSLMFAESDKGMIFTDIIHVTQEARSQIAEAIYPFIESRLPTSGQ